MKCAKYIGQNRV